MRPIPSRVARLACLPVAAALLAAGCGGGGGVPKESTGNITGLVGSGLVLLVNGSTNVAVAAGASSYRYPTNTMGTEDTVSVVAQPTSPLQVCSAAGQAAVRCETVQDLVFATERNLRSVQGLSVLPSTGALATVATSRTVLPTDATPAAIAVTPDAKGLHVVAATAGGGAGRVYSFGIDAGTGALVPAAAAVPATGAIPIGIAVHPGGRFVYVSARDGLYGYRIDAATGGLVPLAGSPFPIPVDGDALAIEPGGRFGYINDPTQQAVAGYAIDAVTGVPTPLAGSPFAAGLQPGRVTVHPAGGFVYASSGALGLPSLTAFAIAPDSGSLTRLPGTPLALTNAGGFTGVPSSLLADPAGRFLWAWGWQALANVKLNAGVPADAPGGGFPAVGLLAVNADGRFVFDALPCCVYGKGFLVGTVDAASGTITPVAGVPFTTIEATSIATVRLR